MPSVRLLLIFIFLTTSACGSRLNIVKVGDNSAYPWKEAYVDFMGGAENLTFDGEGAMFVSGLNGFIYKIRPSVNPYRGYIEQKRKIGGRCFDIEVGPDGKIYVGIEDELENDYENSGKMRKLKVRRIAKLSKNLSIQAYLSDHIPGLNGMTVDNRGYLYFTSSKFSSRKGKIGRVKIGKDEDFKHPEIILDNLGIVNGLTIVSGEPEEPTLYYTELNNGVWKFQLGRSDVEPEQVFIPRGWLPIFDDLTTDRNGDIWFTMNSEQAIVFMKADLKNGQPTIAYQVGSLGAPSSCKFGKGAGFQDNFLYITEFGLKGKSWVSDGRGLWVLPVEHIFAPP